jgi:protoporphyrinogen oxidase
MPHQQQTDRIVVVGGGATGLAFAFLAAKAGQQVTVLEADHSFGGLLNTFSVGGGELERYYHHFFTHDLELNWLVEELGLSDRLFYKKTSMGIFRNGRMYPFNSPSDLLRIKPLSIWDKLRFGLTSIYLGKLANWRNYEHISCLKWLRKWAGKGSSDFLWAPLLSVKFGPYAGEVPLSWMIGRLRQRLNSRRGGDESLGYLQGSLQVLLDALLEQLKAMGVELVSGAPVQALHFKHHALHRIDTPLGSFSADRFVFTIPTVHLHQLVAPQYPAWAAELQKIAYFGAVCVILELNRPLTGVYWLNIADSSFPFGGVIEHTQFIDREQYGGSHIVYLSRYFATSEPIAKMDKEAIVELMLPFLSKINSEFDRSSWVENIHVFKTNTAATVCDLGFSSKVPRCQSPCKNLYVASMPHVYPDERSTNNAIRVAAETCRVMAIPTTLRPKTNSLAAQIGF